MVGDVSMDTAPDYTTDQDDVVRWVPSQSPNPALQALLREAEKEKRVRPVTSTSVEPSWSRTLSTGSDSSLWLPSTRTSSLPSLSTSTSSDSSPPSASPSSLATHTRGLEDSLTSTSSRSKLSSYTHVHGQRKPLSASASSANQAVRLSRPRSSSHSASASTVSKNSVEPYSKRRIPDGDAAVFLTLLRDVSRQVDENSRKKQKVAAKVRDRQRGHRDGITAASNLPTTMSAPDVSGNVAGSCTFIKTSIASSISGANTSISSRALTRTTSLGLPTTSSGGTGSASTTVVSGSNSRVAPASTPRILSKSSSVSNVTTHLTSKPVPIGERVHGCKEMEKKMANVTRNTTVDNDTHSEDGWDGNGDRAMCVDTSSADLLTSNEEKGWEESCMQVDVAASKSDADMAMDMSVWKPPPALAPKVAPKSKPGFSEPPIQRLTSHRAPPLGMRRPALLSGASQSVGLPGSQYGLSQASGTKGTVPRFKPPLLSGPSGTKSSGPSRASSKTDPPSRASFSRPAFNAESKIRLTRLNDDDASLLKEGGGNISSPQQDPDSSFDVSFDMDADALEEAMQAYD